MNAYDIEFGENGDDGWCGGRPPGIPSVQWPRSRVNGTPMKHLFTLRIPEEYRMRGPEFMAFSVFQADDHVADTLTGVKEVFEGADLSEKQQAIPFWQGLHAHVSARHAMERYLQDEIDGGWALIWLREEEFTAPKTEVPEHAKAEGYDSNDGMNALDDEEPAENLKLIVREGDPNVGKTPQEFPAWLRHFSSEPVTQLPEGTDLATVGYIPMWSKLGETMGLSRFHVAAHFGGTDNTVQSVPEGLSPYYFEFSDNLGNPNLGGDGTCQIDLLNEKLSWACG